jgi:hypothetical protein
LIPYYPDTHRFKPRTQAKYNYGKNRKLGLTAERRAGIRDIEKDVPVLPFEIVYI